VHARLPQGSLVSLAHRNGGPVHNSLRANVAKRPSRHLPVLRHPLRVHLLVHLARGVVRNDHPVRNDEARCAGGGGEQAEGVARVQNKCLFVCRVVWFSLAKKKGVWGGVKKKANHLTAVTPTYGGFKRWELDKVAGSAKRSILRMLLFRDGPKNAMCTSTLHSQLASLANL